jgi:hypothetical protein
MKTAVEWFYQRILAKDIESVFNQAKELEKQQIMKAVYDSMGTNLDPNLGRAEQYYNETFKSE